MKHILRRRASAEILVGVLLFFALDAAVFRTGFYGDWIDPTSRDGSVTRSIENGRRAAAGSVLVLGDSRIGEGFSARAANQEARAAGSDVTFANGGVGSSTPRAWYYFLREHLAQGHRPRAVAVMATSFHDDEGGDLADRRLDIGLVHQLTGLGDAVDFPTSFVTTAARLDALQSILLSGFYYKADLAAFLTQPVRRITAVGAWRQNGFEWLDMYPGRASSVEGLELDMASGRVMFPAAMPPGERAVLESYAGSLRTGGAPRSVNAATAAYRSIWFNRLADLCGAAGIELMIFRIPRGPLHFMADDDEGVSGSLAALRASGRAQLLPASSFHALERQEFFFDDLHLNAQGRSRFSSALVGAILPVLRRRD